MMRMERRENNRIDPIKEMTQFSKGRMTWFLRSAQKKLSWRFV